jgi:hypothetical protein
MAFNLKEMLAMLTKVNKCYLEGLRKTTKTTVRIASLQAEI